MKAYFDGMEVTEVIEYRDGIVMFRTADGLVRCEDPDRIEIRREE